MLYLANMTEPLDSYRRLLWARVSQPMGVKAPTLVSVGLEAAYYPGLIKSLNDNPRLALALPKRPNMGWKGQTALRLILTGALEDTADILDYFGWDGRSSITVPIGGYHAPHMMPTEGGADTPRISAARMAYWLKGDEIPHSNDVLPMLWRNRSSRYNTLYHPHLLTSEGWVRALGSPAASRH